MLNEERVDKLYSTQACLREQDLYGVPRWIQAIIQKAAEK